LILRSIKRKYVFLVLTLFAIITGGAVGAGFTYLYDFPELEYLQNYRPSTITRIYAHDGQVIARLFQERRLPIPLARIPLQMRQAFLAIEKPARTPLCPGRKYHHATARQSALPDT
jgi:penicillin-binding protein 1A